MISRSVKSLSLFCRHPLGRRSDRGWSFIDLMIGIVILIVVFLSGIAIVRVVIHNRVNNREIAQLNTLQNRTVEDLRTMAINENFDLFPPTFSKTRSTDGPYTIDVTMGPIDLDKKRAYTVTVKGPTKTSVRNGFMTRQRGMVGGGSVDVFVHDSAGNPVQNVSCSAPAFGGGPDLIMYTAADGHALLGGVLPGNGINISIDTILSGYFFSSLQGVSIPGFVKVIAQNIVGGATIILDVEVTSPSTYKVKVVNYDGGAPVENAEVMITCGATSPPSFIRGRKGYTGNDGMATFTVFPGQCWAYNIGSLHDNGSVRFAGTALPDDLNEPVPLSMVDTIGLNDTVLRTIKTLPVGKATGSINLIHFTGGNFDVSPAVFPNAGVHLMVNRSMTLGDDDARFPTPSVATFWSHGPFNFWNTAAGQEQVHHQTPGCYNYQIGFLNQWCYGSDPSWMVVSPVKVGGNTTYEAFLTPTIIHANLDTYNRPYNATTRSVSYWAIPPATPILVMAPGDSYPANLNSVAFAGHFSDWRTYWSPPVFNSNGYVDEVDKATKEASFGVIMYANQTTTMNFYLLHENALASMHGSIVTKNATPVPTFFKSRLMLYYGQWSLGAVVRDTSNNNIVQSSFIQEFPPNSAPSNYDLDSDGMKHLVPNVGTSVTRVFFEGYSETTASPEFDGFVHCHEKVLDVDGTSILMSVRPDSACNITGLNIDIGYTRADGTNQTAFSGAVNVSNGEFLKSVNNIPFKSNHFVGSGPDSDSPGVALTPGSDPNVTITIGSVADDTYNFSAAIRSNQTCGWLPMDFLPKPFYIGADIQHLTMTPDFLIAARTTAVSVRGYVVDPKGTPVDGVQVVVQTSGQITASATTSGTNDACAGCSNLTTAFTPMPTNGKFQYNVSTSWKHTPEPNLYVSVNDSPGYDGASSGGMHLYYENRQNPSEPLTEVQVNFVLQPKVAAAPTPGKPKGF